jgi:hypothetical protein
MASLYVRNQNTKVAAGRGNRAPPNSPSVGPTSDENDILFEGRRESVHGPNRSKPGEVSTDQPNDLVSGAAAPLYIRHRTAESKYNVYSRPCAIARLTGA